MILVRSAAGEDFLNRATAAGVLELRPAEEEPGALGVMDRLARKQRERIDPFDPHANARWVSEQALAAARAETTSAP